MPAASKFQPFNGERGFGSWTLVDANFQADQCQAAGMQTGCPSVEQFVDGDEPSPTRPSAMIEIRRFHVHGFYLSIERNAHSPHVKI
jgi:hypothetical protein